LAPKRLPTFSVMMMSITFLNPKGAFSGAGDCHSGRGTLPAILTGDDNENSEGGLEPEYSDVFKRVQGDSLCSARIVL
jgi:hypothetical protein